MELSKNAIARRIKGIRLALGKNTREFGEMFNPPASDSIVSRWESAKSLPNSKRLAKIAELGGISTKELIYGDERNYVLPILSEVIKKYYHYDLSNNLDELNSVLNRLNDWSFDSTEESLYFDNKEVLDDLLFYPLAWDSEGYIEYTPKRIRQIQEELEALYKDNVDSFDKETQEDIVSTLNKIQKILNQASNSISNLPIDSNFTSDARIQKEIKENANTEILDPKHN